MRGLWFHADAAWGGAAVLSDHLRPHLRGIEASDSLTCDAHKWLSVATGTGMFFCKHKTTIKAAFSTDAAYVPARRDDGRSYNYLESMQWGRRFTGLKLFFMLAGIGMAGIAKRLDHQARMGDHLRNRLKEKGWWILNKTNLPVVCFSHSDIADAESKMERIVNTLKREQMAWISRTLLRSTKPCLRACIVNYRTQTKDIGALVEGLDAVRARVMAEGASGQ